MTQIKWIKNMSKLRDNQLVICKNENGEVQVNMKRKNEAMWLTQEQMARLFNTEGVVIMKYVNRILAEGELDKAVCAIFAHTASDGKMYDIRHYNLDMVISVGYRVSSKKGREFREFVSKILKDHLTQDIRDDRDNSIDHEKLIWNRLNKVKQTTNLL